MSEQPSLKSILKNCRDVSGSDIFITADKPVCIKVHGEIKHLNNPPLTANDAESYVYGLMSEEQKAEFKHTNEMNFAIYDEEHGRFRVSAFCQRGFVGAVLRRIESEIPTLAALGLPKIMGDLAIVKRGLILLVGQTGSGKSSSLAAMIDYRNTMVGGHILTIEDPIEYVHKHKKGVITQREIGIDTESYEIALKNSLRQTPDVILIGEIRTMEVMSYAIHYAETGHLCLATLHANNSSQTLDRIINFFPEASRAQLWSDLAINLNAIIAQRLIPKAAGDGLVPGLEILINTPVVADSISKGDTSRLKEYMLKGAAVGMHTFDEDLYKLAAAGIITEEAALQNANSKSELSMHLRLSRGVSDANLSDLDIRRD